MSLISHITLHLMTLLIVSQLMIVYHLICSSEIFGSFRLVLRNCIQHMYDLPQPGITYDRRLVLFHQLQLNQLRSFVYMVNTGETAKVSVKILILI